MSSTSHFANIGLVCPLRANPADFFMKILSVNYPKGPEDQLKVTAILDNYETNLKSQVAQESTRSSFFTPDLEFYEERRLGFLQELRILLWRNSVGFVRDPIHAKVKISQTIFTALLCLALFRGHEGNSFGVEMSLIGSIFFICVDIAMENVMNTVLAFQGERPIFLREQANQMYSVRSYYLARIMVDTPIQLLLPLFFSLIIYFNIGLTITMF